MTGNGIYPGYVLAGRYRLERSIGSGKTSTVYSAHDLWRKSAVAVKIIAAESPLKRVSSRLHRLEIEAMSRLDHPSIARIFDAGVEPELNREYIVMERVDGDTLERVLPRIRHRGYLRRLEFALSILGDLRGALTHAHAAGIIHRDIKPQNLMLKRSGRIVVTDFGVARVEGTRKYTLAGVSLGTPLYMAPEQLTGQDCDESCDVYALGVLFHNLLGEKHMFLGCDGFAALLAEKLKRSVLYLPNSAPATVAAIGKAVAVEREFRFATVADFLNELEIAISSEIAAQPAYKLEGKVELVRSNPPAIERITRSAREVCTLLGLELQSRLSDCLNSGKRR